MEALIKFDRAIIEDTMVTHQAPIGKIDPQKLDVLRGSRAEHLQPRHYPPLRTTVGKAGFQCERNCTPTVTIKSHIFLANLEINSSAITSIIKEATGNNPDLLIESNKATTPEINEFMYSSGYR